MDASKTVIKESGDASLPSAARLITISAASVSDEFKATSTDGKQLHIAVCPKYT